MILGDIEEVSSDEEEAKKEVPLNNDLLISAYLNSAMCHMKTENFREAINNCNKALIKDEKNVKALFRRGTAKAKMGEYEEAKDGNFYF